MTVGTLALRPSRWLLMAGLVVHAMALYAVWLSGLVPAWQFMAGVGVCLSLWSFVAGQLRPAWTSLRAGDGVVTLSGPGGELSVSPPAVCFMACGVVLLRFRYRRAKQRQRLVHLLLLPDSLTPRHRRSLYRYLGGWSDEVLTH